MNWLDTLRETAAAAALAVGEAIAPPPEPAPAPEPPPVVETAPEPAAVVEPEVSAREPERSTVTVCAAPDDGTAGVCRTVGEGSP